VLRVREDVPGERLRLEWVGKPVLPLKARLGCLAVGVAGALGVLASFASEDDTGLAGILLAFVLFGGVLLAVVVFPSREPLSLDVKGREGRLELARGLPGHRAGPPRSVAFSEIETVTVAVPHRIERDGQRALPLRLVLNGPSTSNPLIAETIRVSWLNTERELVDFLLRLGNVLGLPYYRIVANDPRDFQARLSRWAEERSRPVPRIREPANYKKGRVCPDVETPAEVVADFDPGARVPGGLRAAVWDPGRTLRIVRRWGALEVLTIAVCVVAPLLAAVAGRRLPGILAQLSPAGDPQLAAAVLVFFGPIGALAAVWILVRASFCCQLDWATRQVSVRRRGVWRRLEMREIEEIALVEKGLRGSSRPVHERFRGGAWYVKYRLEARLRRGVSEPLTIVLYGTSSRRLYRGLYPLAAALARSLGVPHRLDTGERPPWRPR
jgi:hypothetical protein